jgi:very-short-patch-repair endonuclease
MTRAEVVLWQALRGKKLAGLKFRRQQVLGAYIADFFCASCRLVVELDGAAHTHEEAQAHDAIRDRWLASQNLCVLRLPNSLVLADLDAALMSIMRAAGRQQEPG